MSLQPFQKILELVESRQLNITEVSLAQITNDFLQYRPAEPSMLADFIVIAAKLLLIKSKALLPNLTITAEEEADLKEFEQRLRLYQQYQPAIKWLKNHWQKKTALFSRPYFYKKPPVIASRPHNLTAPNLLIAIKKARSLLEKSGLENASLQQTIISVEKKIRDLLQHFRLSHQQKFTQLTSQRSTGEIVATFLAILHLLKDNIIQAKQTDAFGDIQLTYES